jgi:glycosyltransferase involved in cell wall biosynthesis
MTQEKTILELQSSNEGIKETSDLYHQLLEENQSKLNYEDVAREMVKTNPNYTSEDVWQKILLEDDSLFIQAVTANKEIFQHNFSVLLNDINKVIVDVKSGGIQFNDDFKNDCLAVQNEISKYQRLKGCKNVIVCANGIGVSGYQVKNLINICKPLKLLFLKGTSTNAEWNGIDRLIHSIDKLEKNSIEIKLIICGHKIDGEIPQRNYIEHRGYLHREDLNQLFDEVDLGVSTFALYKKNLQEAAVLKTREYIARGLPFIYAYIDPDLNEGAKEFSLEFPNDDSLIDMQKVIDFAQKALEDKELPKKMRKYAEEHLDYEVNMKKLVEELMKLNK